MENKENKPTAQNYEKERYDFSDLAAIIERLTAPDGCPWDKAQTHKSIRINMLEEAYEAVDAIDRGDKENLVEELGDIMLQSVLHADIARRNGEFTLDDVVTRLCRKLVDRHTHVFGADKAANAGQALGFWEAAKAGEKGYSSIKEQIEKYPQAFPAALRAQKTFKKLFKASGCGTEEIRKAFLDSFAALTDNTRSSALAGEFLFLAIGVSALAGFDAEAELNDYCRRVTELSGNNTLIQIIDKLRKSAPSTES